jgi:sortase A
VPSTVWRLLERLAWAVGLTGVTVWGALLLVGTASARSDVARFRAAAQAGAGATSRPDTALWSPARIKAWEDSLAREAPDVLAVLKIPRLHLEVPVLEGTDDWILNRGAGHIEDTAEPAERGNVGIAGHRDGFFRPLKDLAVGDVLELELRKGTERYRVEKIWIVGPEDVSVLDPTPSKAVTLVTCYPFYFVGAAPQRFIARAVPEAR